jgi:hypothetical protein
MFFKFNNMFKFKKPMQIKICHYSDLVARQNHTV